jgi:polysaccharide pyruvyl transferase WcaK-like protein
MMRLSRGRTTSLSDRGWRADATGLPTPAIAVWGHFHGRNLGDELVVAVIIDAIRRRVPEAHVLAVSMAPRDAEQRHGVPAVSINPGWTVSSPAVSSAYAGGSASRATIKRVARMAPGARRARALVATMGRLLRELPFLVRAYRTVRGVETIVVTGSGQLLDAWRGPWEHPYTTFRWALLARIAGKEMVYPSVGAGPIDGRLSALLIRKSLEWASFVSVRDDHSATVLRSIGVARDLPWCPDMGWAQDFAGLEVARTADGSPLVGVNAMSHEDPRYWPRGDVGRYRAYLGKVADFVARLLEEGNGVLLFSSQTRSDRLVAEDLRQLLARRELDGHPQLEWAVDDIDSVDDLVRTIARCDYVVAGRFHCVLLPLALGIPALGLAYHPKTHELLEQIGRPERCFDIDSFEVPELVAALERLRAEHGPEERSALHEQAERLRVAVEAQFDALFGPRSARLPHPSKNAS